MVRALEQLLAADDVGGRATREEGEHGGRTFAPVEEVERLAAAGCEIVRITAPSVRDAEALGEIRAELFRRAIAPHRNRRRPLGLRLRTDRGLQLAQVVEIVPGPAAFDLPLQGFGQGLVTLIESETQIGAGQRP